MQDVSTFVLNNLTKVVKTRLGVTKLSNSKNTKKPKKPKAKGSAKGSSNNGVIELDEGNFDSMAGDGGYWFVMFYAPWCGHCQNLEPTWAQLAGQLSGKVNVARVDATAQTSLAERFNVQGYPTLIMMRNQKTKVYRGARELDDLRSFALDVAKDAAKAVALKSNTHFEESCADSPCFVAILPQPEDLSSEERKQYLAAYNKAIQANASHNAKHFYMTGGNSLEFEQALNLGFGYPTLVVINKKRSGFGVMRGAFNEKAMTGFLRSSGALQALPPTLPTLKDEL
ncbi:MAG: uncharacterized protein KVP18_001608 [Porospora cf. gigantea A]|uniref:uncharacterized protein n=1 Tax=Porospora cf. gigantea A TaxID=2853593 RepID=UPI00355A2C27|nr:MAG: hypothetical protein KVP18_001608 [Porospora cf. gigantea A]